MTELSANTIPYYAAKKDLEEKDAKTAGFNFNTIMQNQKNTSNVIPKNNNRIASTELLEGLEAAYEGINTLNNNKYIRFLVRKGDGLVAYILEFQKNSKKIKVTYGPMNTKIYDIYEAHQVDFTVEGTLNRSKGSRNLIIDTKDGSKFLDELVGINLAKLQQKLDIEKVQKDRDRRCIVPFTNFDRCKFLPILNFL